jgi:hypothetical protein
VRETSRSTILKFDLMRCISKSGMPAAYFSTPAGMGFYFEAAKSSTET